MKKAKYHTGFTLAELLIALALLGIIAAFTIPKVLQASSDQETNAKLRETVATLENAWYGIRDKNEVNTLVGLQANLLTVLNVISSSNGPADIGAGAPLQSLGSHPCIEANAMGWLLFPNGVVVTGIAINPPLDMDPPTAATHDWSKNGLICIDVNSAASPNLPGQDVFLGNFNQYGGFVASPTSENAALKSFNWGNEGSDPLSDIYATGSNGILTTPTYVNVGDGDGYTPSAVVGSRLARS